MSCDIFNGLLVDERDDGGTPPVPFAALTPASAVAGVSQVRKNYAEIFGDSQVPSEEEDGFATHPSPNTTMPLGSLAPCSASGSGSVGGPTLAAPPALELDPKEGTARTNANSTRTGTSSGIP